MLAEVTPEQLTETCGEAPSWFCERVLELTENEGLAEAVDFFVAKPLTILFLMVGAWFVNRVVRRGIKRFVRDLRGERVQRALGKVRRSGAAALLRTSEVPSLRSVQRAETIGTVLRSLSSALVYGVALLLVLGELGVNLGPLLAGAGIAGVALGFGAQSLVKDFLSGIFMLIEDQYGVGDIIDVGDSITGEVEGVSLRVTRLRDIYGTVWHVPNGEIARVGNKSQNWARAVLDVEVAYSTDLDAARDVILDVAKEMREEQPWRDKFLEAPEIWGIQNLGADGCAIRLVIKVRPLTQWDIERELRRRLKIRFDEDGIEIPFPQRTVWIRQED